VFRGRRRECSRRRFDVKTICVTAMFRSPDRLTRAGIHSPVNAMTIDQPTWCSVFTNTST